MEHETSGTSFRARRRYEASARRRVEAASVRSPSTCPWVKAGRRLAVTAAVARTAAVTGEPGRGHARQPVASGLAQTTSSRELNAWPSSVVQTDESDRFAGLGGREDVAPPHQPTRRRSAPPRSHVGTVRRGGRHCRAPAR
ncbi:unnamed protein product [Lampetra planeri]